jgi:UDP-N-acetylmuramyl pentapeptide phosphotransferase/UDP-N-acetylglucosamine-1-phosphate transferase
MSRDNVSVIAAEPSGSAVAAAGIATRLRHLGIVALLALAVALAWGPWQAEVAGGGAAATVAANTPVFVALLACLIAAFVSFAACWAIVRFQHLHARFSLDAVDTGPQKFHAQPTPRVGGVGLALGLIAAYGFMRLVRGDTPTVHDFGLLLLCGIPAFAGGLVEDLTKKVGVTDRLLLTMLSGAMAAWLLGAVLDRVGIPGVDRLLVWGAVAIPFTIFAVGGVANAINIIDGYNGLVAGYAIIVLLAFAWVAHQLGDTLITITALTLAAAIAGFMRWNWPGGKIFLGDGGAYAIGYLFAELSVTLTLRHPGVSPWLPMALLIYPIYETIFSVFRRRIIHRTEIGQPDAAHLHQLIYFCLAPERDARGRLLSPEERNSRIAGYIWLPVVVSVSIAAAFWERPAILALTVVGFCLTYTVAYLWIAARQRAPGA